MAQSIPVRQQVKGQDFCVVFCGIRCPVNLHHLCPAILKMWPKILLPPPQSPRFASSNSAWLHMPMPHALFAITKMQNETVLVFWHCKFWYMKMSYCFSHRFNLQCCTDIDRLWLPWYCICSILTEWVTSTLNFEEWNWLIKCKLHWLDTFWCSVTTSYQSQLTIKNLYLKSKFHITKENVDFNSKSESALFRIQPSVMLMAITSKVFDKNVWYLVWRRRKICPIISINRIVNDGNIGVKVDTWIWVSILFVNAVWWAVRREKWIHDCL